MTTTTLGSRARWTALLLLFGTLTLRGGVPPAPATGAARAVPELFAGEMDDVGPQYLLLPAQARLPLELWTECEITGTSNATLVESNPHSSTITSMQVGATAPFTRKSWRGGELEIDAGFRLQTYRYGLLAQPRRKINFIEIDRNDFDLIGAHLQGAWRREGWFASAALRGASLENRANHRVFYQEASFEWQLFRQWRAGARGVIVAGLEGAMRWSHTDSFGLLPAGWNNRVEQALVVVYDRSIAARWRLQPAVRVLASEYLHRNRARRDVHGSARPSLIRRLGEQAELRLSIGYDRRNSSEPLIADFAKWDAALAAGAHWRF